MLGHLSFHNLRVMAALGILPKKLLKAKIPKYSYYMHVSTTKKTWRSRRRNGKRKIIPANAPGDCVSVYTVEFRTPGFVAQLKGMLTKRRYKFATMFKDH